MQVVGGNIIDSSGGFRKQRRNIVLFTALVALVLLMLTDLSMIIVISLALSIYSFVELMWSVGKVLPLKELTSFLMVLQLLLAPYLDYFYLKPKGISMMGIGHETYFGYALPAVFAFIIGMKLRFGKERWDEMVFRTNITNTEKKMNSTTGVALVCVGYFFFLLQNFLVVPGFEFFIVVLALFRFVGLFYLWFSGNRFTLWYMLVVLVPTVIITIRGSIFIDLVIWFFFIYAFAAIKYKIKIRTTLTVCVATLFILLILQSVKMQYRSIEWKGENIERETSGLDLFTSLFSSSLKDIDERKWAVMESNFIMRLNQGWIVSHVLKKDAPNSSSEQRNYFGEEVVGILLPRFIYEDKAKVGDNKKFRSLTGIPLKTSVAMNVGVLGDGYGNFGYAGGIIFCFGFGLFLNFAMMVGYKKAGQNFSVLFWLPLIFFYAMRAGNEFYIIANWIVKVGLLVAIYFYFSKRLLIKQI